MEELKKQQRLEEERKAHEQDLNNAMQLAKELNLYEGDGKVNGSAWAKLLQSLQKISEDEAEQILIQKLGDNALNRIDVWRDGGSRTYILNDKTKIHYNNSISDSADKIGLVTVTYPDKTSETYNRKGERFK